MALPVPTGEYAVGTFTYTVRDDRPEALNPSAMRSVASRVYYPVPKDRVEGCVRARSLSRHAAEGIRRIFRLRLDYDRMEASGENRSECYENAPRPDGVKFPLVVFNHALASYREGNSFLCIDLASHGYVVISVAHALDALCTEFDDGSFVAFDRSIPKKLYQPRIGGMIAALKMTRAKGTPEELSARFDAFQDKYCGFQKGRLLEWVKDTQAAVNYAREHLSSLIDFGKGIGAAGHSFGGDTAYRLCVDDPEYVCGVNIDGAPFGDYRNVVQKKPFMHICCSSNEKLAARMFLRHEKPVWKVLFRDMKHVGFSDMKHRLRFASMAGRLPPDAMHENLCRCHLAFFDAYLKGIRCEPDLKSNDVITVTKFEADCGRPDGAEG